MPRRGVLKTGGSDKHACVPHHSSNDCIRGGIGREGFQRAKPGYEWLEAPARSNSEPRGACSIGVPMDLLMQRGREQPSVSAMHDNHKCHLALVPAL